MTSFQLPKGMRDLLPDEARAKRKLENMLMNKFYAWGYDEVVTPVLEYYENLIPAETPEDQFFKLIDRQGHILALRTDMTTPIARMVANRFSLDDYPLKLFYLSNVFRYENIQMGRQREFYQAGVEYIGMPGPAADAEVIALAVECLRESGLNDFQISVGHRDFLRGVINQLELEEEFQEQLISAAWEKDYVALENLLHLCHGDADLKELILSLPSLRGNMSIVKKAVKLIKNPIALAALENLEEIYRLLKVYQANQPVFMDFGIVRDFDYYSGMVFEGYSPGIGAPICGGGRYDYLLGRYGLEAPATGFAIGLERLMLALGKPQEKSFFLDYLVISEDLEEGIKKAQELRRSGFSVRIAEKTLGSLPQAKEVIELVKGDRDERNED
ncbi:MAG: ATP phosphoribosyltransferase regulatory subunit [Dehalobacterium sp.]